MKTLHQVIPFRPLMVAAALAALAGMSACSGGGGGSDGAPADNAQQPPPTAPSAGIKVDGQSQPVQPSNGQVKFILAPSLWVPGTVSGNTSTVEAVNMVPAAPGAYAGFPVGNVTIALTRGTITDLSGNGQYAIGRWTDGSDSGGGTYNVNQGRVWAVGTPLSVSLAAGQTLTCKLAAASRPTATNGNVAPGALEAATATFTGSALGTPTGSLSLQYSIGADQHQTFNIASAPGNGATSNQTQQWTLISTLAGTDAAHPWYLVTWAIPTPSAGQISGVAALGCELQG